MAAATVSGAAARVEVANEFGKAQADTTYSTTVTVSGTGFQSIKGGFGGIYVLFGWVDSGSWRPSKGGKTSNGDLLYVPDASSKTNAGFQKYVAFPGASTAADANGGTISAKGAWKTTLVIPGPTFQATGKNGAVTEVNCRKVQCGIITIGAHGVVNASNETFTPISFADIYGEDTAATDKSNAGASSSSGKKSATGAAATASDAAGSQTRAEASSQATATVGSGADSQDASDEDGGDGGGESGDLADEATAVAATLKVDFDTAVVGRVLAFTATGFTEGEQVVVVFDDGQAAVGPLVAGKGGALAGLLTLPGATQMGTHTLAATGATSGTKVSISFPVRAADTTGAITNASETAAAPRGAKQDSAFAIAAVVSALLLVGASVWRVLATRRRRGAGRRTRKGAQA
ncbi:hypothetical protein GCM10010407_14300 [Rarobacter incanus]